MKLITVLLLSLLLFMRYSCASESLNRPYKNMRVFFQPPCVITIRYDHEKFPRVFFNKQENTYGGTDENAQEQFQKLEAEFIKAYNQTNKSSLKSLIELCK